MNLKFTTAINLIALLSFSTTCIASIDREIRSIIGSMSPNPNGYDNSRAGIINDKNKFSSIQSDSAANFTSMAPEHEDSVLYDEKKSRSSSQTTTPKSTQKPPGDGISAIMYTALAILSTIAAGTTVRCLLKVRGMASRTLYCDNSSRKLSRQLSFQSRLAQM